MTTLTLYPTKARKELLVAVFAGRVSQADGHSWLVADDDPAERLQRLDARMAEMERAGWVYLNGPSQTWRLTMLGRQVMNGRMKP